MRYAGPLQPIHGGSGEERMSRLYDALRKAEPHNGNGEGLLVAPETFQPVELIKNIAEGPDTEVKDVRPIPYNVSPSSRLVSISDPKSLGAEKFRALANRLANIRSQREMKSLIVTSSVINEGKSVVAANLAFTLARYAKANVLLIEGDLHRPALTSLLGIGRPEGLGDWWEKPGEEIANFVCQLHELPLWFLSAGKTCDYPCDLLQSERLAAAMTSITSQYDWIIVDSSPVLPLVDANLWSRFVDGTILVVREKVTPVPALKKGLESLDNPKLIGIVVNDASEASGDYSRYAYNGK